MKRVSPVVAALCAGCAAAQIIATFQVRFSNGAVLDDALLLERQGYFIIPAGKALSALAEWSTAFLGGLFFTCTIGAGLSLAAVAAMLAIRSVPLRRIVSSAIVGFLWIVFLGRLLSGGVDFFITAYGLIVPSATAAVFALFRRTGGEADRGETGRRRIFHVLAPGILLLLWLSHAGDGSFLDFRDSILLSNPPGRAVNDFYYRYTLYPAEAVKFLEAKTLKTCRLENLSKPSIETALRRVLLPRDYLPVGPGQPAKLVVRQRENELELYDGSRRILTVAIHDFLVNCNDRLKDFSERTDRYGPLRQATYFALLLATPLAFYLLLWSILAAIFSAFTTPPRARLWATVLSCAVGIALFAPFYRCRTAVVSDVSASLRSSSPFQRVAALKVIDRTGVPKGLPPEDLLEGRPDAGPAERYWRVRVLSRLGTEEAVAKLVDFSGDSNRNVRVMALRGIGEKGRRDYAGLLRDVIVNSDDWYIQWYGYRALKSLGWTQR